MIGAEGDRGRFSVSPVNKIIPFSNVDGPGNRTAIFFQGCSFDCMFCHNPETIHMCTGCGLCVSKCPAGALGSRTETGDGSRRETENRPLSPSENRPLPPSWDSRKCVQCDTCIHICPHDASPRIRWMSVPELAAEIRRTAPYIQGITVSGGECTLQNEFLIELFKAVRDIRNTSPLSCLLDSNGSFDFEKDPRILSVSDGVMLDVKAVSREWSMRLIGSPGDMVLKNLDYLQKAGKLQEVRTVIFEGRDQENEETVRYVAERISKTVDYRIIRYRPFGVREKFRKVLGEDTVSSEYAEQYVALAKSLGAAGAYMV